MIKVSKAPLYQVPKCDGYHESMNKLTLNEVGIIVTALHEIEVYTGPDFDMNMRATLFQLNNFTSLKV